MAISLQTGFSFHQVLRLLGVAALLTFSAAVSQRAEALSPINPGAAATGKAAASGLTIEVRGGHGGGSGGGGGGGAGRSSGGWSGSGGHSFSGAAVRSGTFSSGPAVAASGPRFVGRGLVHRRHGVFVGGVYYDDYPFDDSYSDYPAVVADDNYTAIAPGFVAGPGCRPVVTAYGPRIICYHRAVRHYAARHTHARGRPLHRRHHHA
jgi:hypothetical protein